MRVNSRALEVPSGPWAAKLLRDDAAAPVNATWKKLPGLVTHTFTHFHLELTVLKAVEKKGEIAGGCRWVRREDLSGEALPSVMRKIIAHVLGVSK